MEAEGKPEVESPPPMLIAFPTTNNRHSHAEPEQIPPLKGRWAHPHKPDSGMEQELGYSPELRDWIRKSGTLEGKDAVSTLNLFACRDGERQVYTTDVQVSGAQVGKEVGAEAETIVQAVSCASTQARNKGWEDAAVLHCPWTSHSADLLGSEE